MKTKVLWFALVAALLFAFAPFAFGQIAGSDISPGRAPSGSGSATRQAVSSVTTLSGTGDIIAGVTSVGSGYTVTLPAATTSGQRVTIVDESNGAGTSAGLLKISRAGSDTIVIDGLSASLTALVMWQSGAFITLESNGTSQWTAVARKGVHIDPRSVSGIKVWFDARRGVTSAANAVSSWADLSGNAIDVTQGTAANKPTLVSLGPHGQAAIRFDGSNDSLGNSSVSFSSGSVSTYAVAYADWAGAAWADVWTAGPIGSTSGMLFTVKAGNTANDWITSDLQLFGAGSNTGVAPRVFVAAQRSAGSGALVVAARAGSASDYMIDGQSPWAYRVQSTGTTSTVTTSPFYLGFDGGTTYGALAISTVLVYDASVSDANHVALQAALQEMCGLP